MVSAGKTLHVKFQEIMTKNKISQSVYEGKHRGGVTVWRQFAAMAAAQHRYLLVQHPHVGHLPLVVLVQPPQLLAHLLHVVVLPDQLDVVLSHRLQLVLQLGVLAGEAAVQGAGETPERAPSWIKSRVLQELVKLLRKTFFKAHNLLGCQRRRHLTWEFKGFLHQNVVFIIIFK